MGTEVQHETVATFNRKWADMALIIGGHLPISPNFSSTKTVEFWKVPKKFSIFEGMTFWRYDLLKDVIFNGFLV